MRDRRSHTRYSAEVDTRCTKVNGCVTVQSSGRTVDISLGGLRAVLSKMIRKGDELLIEMRSPHSHKEVAFITRVVWTGHEGNHNRNIYGMKFLWVSSEEVLKDWVGFAGEISAPA